MPVKPLTVAQKTVLRSLTASIMAAEIEANVPAMKGFHKHILREDPLAAQADRAFKKMIEEKFAEYASASKTEIFNK